MKEKIGDVILWLALALMVASMIGTILTAGNDVSGYVHKVVYMIALGAIGGKVFGTAVTKLFNAYRRTYDEQWLNVVNDETPTKRLSIPAEMRRFIIERDAFTCSYCQSEGAPDSDPDGQAWHIDHIVPVRRGGKTIPQNLTLACTACNLSKGAKTPVEFMRYRQKQGRWKRWHN